MGFNISEIVQGSGWKNFMKYLYGWGASIVILGALFKILHLPGATIMLNVRDGNRSHYLLFLSI